MDARNQNPYRTPQTQRPPWFRWRRLPYALACFVRGYYCQLRKDGGTLVGHFVCWCFVLILSSVTLVVVVALVRSFVLRIVR